ncbi:hypothetical protein [Microbacterium sp. CIAB417]|uniref:hypothetical protein n=1 Tax=Microbacterium sp. CIAB417 TaxID=2860287 RepID=UPI001FABD764|nr:hypothetical protein [Microbacterium sp. CIAB417]
MSGDEEDPTGPGHEQARDFPPPPPSPSVDAEVPGAVVSDASGETEDAARHASDSGPSAVAVPEDAAPAAVPESDVADFAVPAPPAIPPLDEEALGIADDADPDGPPVSDTAAALLAETDAAVPPVPPTRAALRAQEAAGADVPGPRPAAPVRAAAAVPPAAASDPVPGDAAFAAPEEPAGSGYRALPLIVFAALLVLLVAAIVAVVVLINAAPPPWPSSMSGEVPALLSATWP